MAASPSSTHRVDNTSEEINSTMDTQETAITDQDQKSGTENEPKAEVEEDEPFKKPALFAVPSLITKRATVTAPSKTPTTSAAGSVKVDKNDENAVVKTELGTDTQHERTKDTSDAKMHTDSNKTKPEAKSKALPKGPAPGKFPPLPYTEPSWGGQAPETPYTIEILKNGAIVDTIPLKDRSFFVVGRLPVCDVSLEHPSISRYHAIIQYRGEAGDTDSVGEERGFYVQDLGSTHGTVVNKNKIPPKTYIRLKVGHVLKFGGSTRLFILQGPEFDEEEESEFTVTELKERARKQREELEKRMMGAGSDDEEDKEEEGENGEEKLTQSKKAKEDSGCSWGMADDAIAEDENEENPFSTEFQEDQEAPYLKDPKKALQGFYDREGEELEFEYEEKSSGTWLCRIKLPVDDALGRQLVAEVTNTGKKKEVMVQCCLEACRMLEARGLLRQEAVSRKRKKKNWEDEDYYDSDDDTFLDRTGTVERKRKERMRKAGKIEERPETYESLVSKLAGVEKELSETQTRLDSGRKDLSGSSTEDPLDAFMTSVRSTAAVDGVERRKLHVHVADLRKEAQRLRKLVEMTRPVQLPSLLPSSVEPGKPKKSLPLFGAMKGGSKFKLKTGTIGKLPPKRPHLPAELFNMKEVPSGGEEEEDEEDEDENKHKTKDSDGDNDEEDKESVNMTEPEAEVTSSSVADKTGEEESPKEARNPKLKGFSPKLQKDAEPTDAVKKVHKSPVNKKTSSFPTGSESKSEGSEEAAAETIPKKKNKGPSKPPVPLIGGQYPDDDPDYCVWVPPVGQTGDGRTHLNDKYGY